jgi:hypothetical protein
MIPEINANQRLIESGASSTQSNSAGALPDNDADVSVQVDYASLIEEAIQTPEADTQAVRRARELLLSGELESSIYAFEAAGNIATFGI